MSEFNQTFRRAEEIQYDLRQQRQQRLRNREFSESTKNHPKPELVDEIQGSYLPRVPDGALYIERTAYYLDSLAPEDQLLSENGQCFAGGVVVNGCRILA